jgi:hypothetical protein
MARPKSIVPPPPWFDMNRYAISNSIDAADWYLNLHLRVVLANFGDDRRARFLAQEIVQSPEPVILRGNSLPISLAFSYAELGPAFTAILGGREPGLGVRPLRGDELYFFEQRLPPSIRDFGRAFSPGTTSAGTVPDGFTGPVDHLFERRMTVVFARIDLSLPDTVLMQDFAEFIANKRFEFEQIGGRQPYRDALQELSTRRRVKLRTFAKLGVLPFLDLQYWAAESEVDITRANYAELLGIDADSFRETLNYAKLLLRPFVLDGWLIGAARDAMRRAARRGSAEESSLKSP